MPDKMPDEVPDEPQSDSLYADELLRSWQQDQDLVRRQVDPSGP